MLDDALDDTGLMWTLQAEMASGQLNSGDLSEFSNPNVGALYGDSSFANMQNGAAPSDANTGVFGGGSTPAEAIMRDHLLSQLPSEQNPPSASTSAQQICNGSNVGFIDSNGRLNVCIYSQTNPPPSSVADDASSSSTTGLPTLATITVTPTPDELAAARAGGEGPVGADDVIGSGLATYSTGMGQLLEKNGVTVASRFGVQYGLSGLVADLPGAVGGAIGLGETYAAYQNGNYRDAAANGTGTIGAIGGAELGAGIGALVPVPPPWDAIPIAAGALLGGIAGAYGGRNVGRWMYDMGFDGLAQKWERMELKRK